MDGATSKAALARSLGVSRQSLYYQPKQQTKDEALRDSIVAVMHEHTAYGSRRLRDALRRNRKTIQRVKQRYHLYPVIRRKSRYPRFPAEFVPAITPNRLKDFRPIQPDALWVGDFTQLWFHGRSIYLATVMDSFTREIVAWQVGYYHTTRLVLDVLEEAKRKRGRTPQFFHTDQGSEYTAQSCVQWLVGHRISPSNSPKGKPWTNGRQESFYATFKLEFGKPHRHQTIEMLLEALGRYIHYYNTKRIHSAFRMPPQQFCAERRYGQTKEQPTP